MSLSDSFKQMKALKDQILTLQTDFLKHIVSVASALLALLIVLKQPSVSNIPFFYATLLLLLSSILFGSMSLAVILFQFRKMDKDLQDSIKKQLHDRKEHFEPVFSKYNQLLKVSEIICFVSFLLALISLVLYAVI